MPAPRRKGPTVSASQSNLSDPHYGYDLVVAVTQASVNTTLKELLLGLESPEVTICYIYDDNNNLVPIDYQTLLVNAQGSDPFKVANGSNPSTDKDLINLTNANYAGGVRAQIGLPDVPLANLPPIATLGSGTSAPVLFNLLCAEFQVTGFQYGPRGSATWTNTSQPSGGTPWYFSSNVYLNSSPSTRTPRFRRMFSGASPSFSTRCRTRSRSRSCSSTLTPPSWSPSRRSSAFPRAGRSGT
jgi:hypothetical protein